jgi:2-oxoglutarate ferredoxin oxidoreductase subunit beta
MKIQDIQTKETNTWCPGCTNMSVLRAVQEALVDLVNEGKIKKENIATACDIGCHAKIFDYINASGFYGLHGRTIPLCLGMKIGNPELTVLGFAGDGATYGEGIAHLIHNCRFNADYTMVVANNKTFALTTGQATPTSDQGYKGASTPSGVKEEALNPLLLALTSGASFVARGNVLDPQQLKKIIKASILHKGFAFIDILQPCLTFNNFIPYLQKHTYKLGEDYSVDNYEKALEKAREWDYSMNENGKVATGIFYKKERPTLADKWSQLEKPWYQKERKIDKEKIMKEFV